MMQSALNWKMVREKMYVSQSEKSISLTIHQKEETVSYPFDALLMV